MLVFEVVVLVNTSGYMLIHENFDDIVGNWMSFQNLLFLLDFSLGRIKGYFEGELVFFS